MVKPVRKKKVRAFGKGCYPFNCLAATIRPFAVAFVRAVPAKICRKTRVEVFIAFLLK